MWGIMQMYGKFAGFHFEQCILWVGNTMDPCWNIYVDFWASSSQLVFSESVCDSMWNIYQYFAVFQKWPNRCLPQKVFGVLGPEFQSSPFFFWEVLSFDTPPNNKSFHQVSIMQFDGVSWGGTRSLANFSEGPFTAEFLKPQVVKRIGFQKRPQKNGT